MTLYNTMTRAILERLVDQQADWMIVLSVEIERLQQDNQRLREEIRSCASIGGDGRYRVLMYRTPEQWRELMGEASGE
jgi:hypothetical protein